MWLSASSPLSGFITAAGPEDVQLTYPVSNRLCVITPTAH